MNPYCGRYVTKMVQRVSVGYWVGHLDKCEGAVTVCLEIKH